MNTTTKYADRLQEFRVRRISPVTGRMLEMPILLTKQDFLLAHRAFKDHTGDRTLIPYLTESQYRFLFEGKLLERTGFCSVRVENGNLSQSRRARQFAGF